MPDARSDWELISEGLKGLGSVAWDLFHERRPTEQDARRAYRQGGESLSALTRLRSQMEQQAAEIIFLNREIERMRVEASRWQAKVEQQEGEIKALKESIFSCPSCRLASIGTQGEQPEITEFPTCFNGCELPAGHTGPHIGGDMIWQNGSDVPPTNIPQSDPRDLRIARLESFVERYRRYHDGVARCESAEKQAECLCSICYEVRAALSAEGKK